MPYKTLDELPPSVREAYRVRCQRVFASVWNETYEKTGDEDRAFAYAHAAAKRCEGTTMGSKGVSVATGGNTEPRVTEAKEWRFVTKALDIEKGLGEAESPRRFRTIASSTIRDSHGDEMSLSALEDMKKAFERGVVIFMNHKYDVPDNVFGQSDRAEIRQSPDTDAHGNPIYDLYIEGFIDETNPKARQLADSIANGIKLGTSIGAFVKKARRNPGGRYIIDQVELKEGSIVGIPVNQRSWVQKAVGSLDEEVVGTIVDVLEDESVEKAEAESTEVENTEVEKAELSAKERKELPDSAFACPEKRLYPIHDEAHVRNALARIANPKNDQCGRDKIIAAAKRFGIGEYADKKSVTEEDLILWAQQNLCENCPCDRSAPMDGCSCDCHNTETTKAEVDLPAQGATTETDSIEAEDVERLATYIRGLVESLVERDAKIAALDARLREMEEERDRIRHEAETVKSIIGQVVNMPLRPQARAHLQDATVRLSGFAPEVANAILKLTEED